MKVKLFGGNPIWNDDHLLLPSYEKGWLARNACLNFLASFCQNCSMFDSSYSKFSIISGTTPRGDTGGGQS